MGGGGAAVGVDRNQSNRLFVAPRQIAAHGGRFFKHTHPRTEQEVVYMIAPIKAVANGDGGAKCLLLEVNSYKHPRAAMFVGQEVHKDGSLYMLTPVDPLFNIISMFSKANACDGGCFVPLDDVVDMRVGEGDWRFGDTIDERQLENICQVQAVGSDAYYRLSDEKVMQWLERKVQQTAKALSQQGSTVSMDTAACSSSFVKATSPAQGHAKMSKQATVYALQLVSEYLPAKRAQKLKKRLSGPGGLSADSQIAATKTEDATAAPVKRKMENDGCPVDDYTKFNKPVEKKPKVHFNAKLKKKVEGQTSLFGAWGKQQKNKSK